MASKIRLTVEFEAARVSLENARARHSHNVRNYRAMPCGIMRALKRDSLQARLEARAALSQIRLKRFQLSAFN